VGLASPSTVHAHLANLERLGHLRRDPTRVAQLLESVFKLFPVLRDYRSRSSSARANCSE